MSEDIQIPTTVKMEDLERFLCGEWRDPFSLLGMHYLSSDYNRGLGVLIFDPQAQKVELIESSNDKHYVAERIHAAGFFEAVIPDRDVHFAYELAVEDMAGQFKRRHDPYSFWPILDEHDQYLINAGIHDKAYKHLGAHKRQIGMVNGVYFAVWAPNAEQVSVIGDFNCWDKRIHTMRFFGNSGIWELFVPEVVAGALYKYEIYDGNGARTQKADPYCFRTEVPPRSASVVQDIDGFDWHDQDWLAARAERDPVVEPVAIYEVHLGSWRYQTEADRPLSYRQLAHQLVDYVVDMGFTHIELMPVTEHPFDGSWGYQVVGYFSPTARFGPPEDFAYLVDYCHQHGIGVILDWVPGHFPRDAHGLALFDGTALYEHADPRQGVHQDWGTLIFNYGRQEVCTFLLSNALFWFEVYHVDGLRVDAVTSMLYLDYSRKAGEWIPNKQGGRENIEAIDFLKRLNSVVYSQFPGVMNIAEESTSWSGVSKPTYSGGLGFGFKWNMGWMNDILSYMTKAPSQRQYYHTDLTFSMFYAYHEHFVLALSHDEVVHGKGALIAKMPGEDWQKRANLRLLLGFMYGHPGKKLLFMGAEFGQWNEWDYRCSLDWQLLEQQEHLGLQTWVRDLNQLYKNHKALYCTDTNPAGFNWIDCQDMKKSVIAFMRQDLKTHKQLIFVFNFTSQLLPNYRLGLPQSARYREVLNSDAVVYGGNNVRNDAGLQSEAIAWHSCAYSAEVTLPPLGVIVFEPIIELA